MNCFRITLFLLSLIVTLQIGLVSRTERIIRTVDEFEPVVVVKQEPETKVKAETRIEAPMEFTNPASDFVNRPLNVTETPEVIEESEITEVIEETETIEIEPESLGEFRVTAYCACEKCCGAWALNRPNGIVYGAAGVELKAGVSCASPLPFGTVIEIDGLGEYVVQDRIAQWVVDKYGENLIDIYFDDHEAARKFGLQYHNIYLKEEM